MRHALRRCRHCGTVYSYQQSGDGCFKDTNDSRWCPTCMEVVNEALSTVPVLFEKVLVPTKDFTFDQLVKIENERFEAAKAAGVLALRQVPVPMFRGDPLPTESLEAHIVLVNNREYFCSRWPSEPHDEQVMIAMERRVGTGQLAPWLPCTERTE
jgi:hypothetical protein